MTKKIFAMFLAVLMVVSMLPTSVFAAGNCPAVHTKDNCEYTVVNVKTANCGEEGFTTYQCNKCKATFVADRVAPVGEHDMKPAEEKDNVPAYCGTKGAEGGMICSICGHREGQKDIDPIFELGVSCEFAAWEEVQMDCTEEFKLVQTCLSCTNTKVIAEHKLQEGVQYAHEYGEWILDVEATPDAPGKAHRECIHGEEGKWSCNAVEEMDVFYAHRHQIGATVLLVPEKSATCTETGVQKHYECRVCGKLFKFETELYMGVVTINKIGEEVTVDELVIPAYHDQLKADKTKLNCKNTSMECDKANCTEIIRIELKQGHTYGDWVPARGATCLLDGYRTKSCSICDHVETENIPALGHATVTKTVDATCVQYGYKYTYCVRPGCNLASTDNWKDKNNNNHEFKVPAPFEPLENPYVAVPMYLAAYNAKEKAWEYLDGTFKDESKGRLNVTKDASLAAQFYIEKVEDVEGGYYVYLIENNAEGKDVKVYIEVYSYEASYGTGYSLRKTETPKTYFTWSKTHNTLVTTLDGDEYGFTSRNGKDNADYVYALGFDYFEVTNPNAADDAKQKCYIFQFYAGFASASSQLLKVEPNYEAGKNPEAHKLVTLSKTEPTCLLTGSEIKICELCNTVMPTETLEKADHVWVDDGLDETVNVPVDCLTDGKEYQKCSVCGVANVKVTPATGHTLKKNNNQVVVDEYKGDHNNIVAYKYNICTASNCPLRNQVDHNKNSLKVFKEGSTTEVIGARVIIESSVTAWSGTGKVYKDEDAAAQDHPGFAITADNALSAWDKNATCTVAGYKAYDCLDCNNTVMIKSWDEVKTVDGVSTTITHTGLENKLVAASCTQEGGYYTYECACGEKIGKGGVGTWNKTADKLSHDWEMEEDYEKVDCDKPNYQLKVKECKVCHEEVYAMTKKNVSDYTDLLCTSRDFEWYDCYECGKTHIRGYVENFGHEWVKVGTPTAATCISKGHQDLVCKWCEKGADEFEQFAALEDIAQLPHKNAAGETFFANDCGSKVTDRHCVDCCVDACKNTANHNCLDKEPTTEGKQPCDCVYALPEHQHEWKYVEETCTSLPYKYEVCSVCFDTKNFEYIKEIKIGDNKEAVVVGHRPVAVDKVNGENVYYGRYDYEMYPGEDKQYAVYNWVDSVDAEGNAIKVLSKIPMPAYEAKYIEYTAPSYTAEGYAKYVCAVCGETHEEVLPAISGLEFVVEYGNANGADEIGFGSLVEVVVSANSLATDVYSFFLNVVAPEDMIYVGYEVINEDFLLTVTDPANVKLGLTIFGRAANDASGKQQNITINEKTPLVKLMFRSFVVEAATKLEGCKECTKDVPTCTHRAINVAGYTNKMNSKDQVNVAGGVELETRAFMDFNGDGQFHITDLQYAEQMLTGESEKTYDVTVDFDKDGRVSGKDLAMAYDVLVNSMSEEAMKAFVFAGIDEAEVELLEKFFGLDGFKYECQNEYCTYGSNDKFNVCPACGKAQ